MDDIDISGISEEQKTRIVRAAVRWGQASIEHDRLCAIDLAKALPVARAEMKAWEDFADLVEGILLPRAAAQALTTALRRDDESARAGLVPQGVAR